MEIKHINGESKGYFMSEVDGVEAGRMTYIWVGNDKFVINHTEVHPDFKGKNIGKQMLMAAVDYARSANVKIIPQCPFVKSVFEKVPEIKDVLL
jgi:predicted GNAT family acetyltransferase